MHIDGFIIIKLTDKGLRGGWKMQEGRSLRGDRAGEVGCNTRNVIGSADKDI